MKKILLFILLFAFFDASFSQNKKDSLNYFERLIYTPTAKSKLLLFQYSYAFTSNAHAVSSHGGHISLGLNISRFFSEKYFIGAFADIKILQGRFKHNFSQRVKDSFNQAYATNNSSSVSQMESETLYGVINELDGYRNIGNNFYNVGIALSPFPDRRGAVLLKLSTGGNLFYLSGPYDDVLEVEKDQSYFQLQTRTKFCAELVFKPFTFTKDARFFLSSGEVEWKDALKLITCSVYLEQVAFKDQLFRTTQLSSIVNPSFFNNQPRIINFGFKIGFGVW